MTRRQTILAGFFAALPLPGAATDTLFRFRNGFWINLHHFLYVQARAKNGTSDSKRAAVASAPAELAILDNAPQPDRDAFQQAIAFYQSGVAKKDLIFDRPLNAITKSIGEENLAGLETDLAETLRKAAPAYRSLWWKQHQESNQARIVETEALLAKYGDSIAQFLAKAYRQTWPQNGYVADVVAYANWAGAYSVTGGVLVIGSGKGPATSQSLETIFHESMHQWDNWTYDILDAAAGRVKKDVPRQLSHSLIFYTAGYATAKFVPGHKPYAESNGMWARGVLTPKEKLDEYWLPYLKGESKLEESVDRLLAAI